MAQNRTVLKVISIVQIVMAIIFFTLGMVDRFKVRYVLSSYLAMPCWMAALVLAVGIMGLVSSNMPRDSPTLTVALRSVSMACAAVSAIAVYIYYSALTTLVGTKYVSARSYELTRSNPYFGDKDAKIKYTDEEETMVAIYSLVIVFSITEIILAIASARSGDAGKGYQPLQENQAGGMNYPVAAGQIPMQPAYIASQPMVAVPVSSYNVNQ